MAYRKETPIAMIHALLRAYRRYGVNPDAALSRAQIAPAVLADPQACITSRQLEQMTLATMRELDDEGLGMYTRRVPWGSFEMLMRASMSSPDLGTALRRWCRFRRILIPDLGVELTVDGEHAWLCLVEHVPVNEVRDFALLSVMRHVHGVASWLIDAQLPLQEVVFPGPPPEHHRAYEVMFPGPIHYGARRAGFCFAAGHLALPVRRDELASRAVLPHSVGLAVKAYRHNPQLLHRLRALLARHVDQPLTADDLARAVNLSTRSLHRKLAHAGVRLQTLKDEARRARAVQLLTHRDMPIKRIATQLGFGGEKSFARAFERWTGHTPQAWREQGLAAAGSGA